MSRPRERFPEYVLARREDLRRLAYTLCGDWHHADDVVQIALTKLYVAWPRIHRHGNEDAYARRIIVNTVVDESRRPWRRHELMQETPYPQAATLVGAVEPTDAVADADDDVVAALQLLPLMQRRVVVLRHWLDLSVSDVAAQLGISEGTVKSHTARAMARLHQLLENPANEEAGR
jgi:RNA polymerase sigma-70 factor (sigma-E family)